MRKASLRAGFLLSFLAWSCLSEPKFRGPDPAFDPGLEQDAIPVEHLDISHERDLPGDPDGVVEDSSDRTSIDLLTSEEVVHCLPTGDEECDGQDNDCDGLTDEDFDLKQDAHHCGTCENDCWNLANVADVACANGSCVISLCQNTFVDTNQKVHDGCECEMTNDGVESCDQRDNDCNGQTDEGLPECCKPGEERDCGFNNLGECRLGKEECLEGGSWSGECLGALLPQDEICDNKDNDCNGSTDEEFDLGVLCEAGIGECKSVGEMVCSEDGLMTVCNALPGDPQGELCDGKDNDCDGATDEDWPELGDPCENGQGECQAGGKLVCDLEGKNTVCDAVPRQPQDESCDHKDNNCNGLTDETFPQLGTNCSTGTGECERKGIFVCNLETGFAKCSVEPGAPQEEFCDNKDNDCDGQTDNVDAAKLQEDNQHCGACFTPCVSLPNATAVACQAGKCQVTECEAEFWDADKSGENGCECQTSSGAVDICDEKDNDCDGQTDEYCENLVLYLPFDGDWLDKSNYGNNATPSNSVTFTNDAISGQAAYFDGVGDYAIVADSPSMDSIGEEFTWMIAAKPLVLAKRQVIFQRDSFGRPGLTIDQYDCSPNFCFWFYISDLKIYSLPFFEANKWYLFTLRYKKGNTNLFINGNLQWSGNSSYPQNIGDKIFIGNIDQIADKPFYGPIDEFIFYNKALSDEEIANYYEKIK